MDAAYQQQIIQFVQNIHMEKKKIPYFVNLAEHPLIGPAIKSLSLEEKDTVQACIVEYIEYYVSGLTTKGGKLFQRFYENHTDEFWEFRILNQDKNNLSLTRFQELNSLCEKEFFTLEGILTSKMGEKHNSDKVIDAFYDIIYAIFPLFGSLID